MAQRNKTAFKKIVGIISVCLFAVCLFGVLGSVICAETVCSKDFYKNALCSGDYADKIYSELKTAAEIKTYIYTVPPETADRLFTKEAVAADCEKYAEYLYNSALSGSTDPMPTEIDADNARKVLGEYINSGGSDVLKPEDADEYIIPQLQELYNSKINAITITRAQSVLNRAVKAARFLRNRFTVLTFLCMAFLMLAVYLGSDKIKTRLYSLSGTAFCVSSLLFAPLFVIERFDIPSRLPLGNSPLKYLADSLIYSFTGKALAVGGIALAVSFVALIAISVLLSRKTDNLLTDDALSSAENI